MADHKQLMEYLKHRDELRALRAVILAERRDVCIRGTTPTMPADRVVECDVPKAVIAEPLVQWIDTELAKVEEQITAWRGS